MTSPTNCVLCCAWEKWVEKLFCQPPLTSSAANRMLTRMSLSLKLCKILLFYLSLIVREKRQRVRNPYPSQKSAFALSILDNGRQSARAVNSTKSLQTASLCSLSIPTTLKNYPSLRLPTLSFYSTSTRSLSSS